MAQQIQLRRDSAADWTSANPTLAEGEIGVETDTGQLKIGTGSTAWASLPYFAGSGGVTLEQVQDDLGTTSLLAGTGITKTYNDGAGTITLAVTGSTYLPLVAAGASVENIGAVESNVQTVAATGATETLDTSAYGVFDMTMDQNCTFTFSNPAPSGKATIFTLILRGAFTPTWPAAVDWPDATQPTYTTPTVYTFVTVDAGTTWLGASAGKAFG